MQVVSPRESLEKVSSPRRSMRLPKFNFEAPKNLWKEHKKTIIPSVLVGLLATVAYIVWGSQPYTYILAKAQGPYEFAKNKSQLHVMTGDAMKDFQVTVAKEHDLREHITTELSKLRDLYSTRDSFKDTWGWFLNYDKQHQVDLVQMDINDQRRIIRNEIEDLNLVRKKLKRSQGIFSKVFFKDVAFSLVEVLARLHVLFPPLGFSLLSFLLLGPAVAAGALLFVALGMTLLPLFVCCSLILWLLHFPTVLLQYDPTFMQFFLCYAVSASSVVVMVYAILYGTGPPEPFLALPSPSAWRTQFVSWRNNRIKQIPIEASPASEHAPSSEGTATVPEEKAEDDALDDLSRE